MDTQADAVRGPATSGTLRDEPVDDLRLVGSDDEPPRVVDPSGDAEAAPAGPTPDTTGQPAENAQHAAPARRSPKRSGAARTPSKTPEPAPSSAPAEDHDVQPTGGTAGRPASIDLATAERRARVDPVPDEQAVEAEAAPERTHPEQAHSEQTATESAARRPASAPRLRTAEHVVDAHVAAAPEDEDADQAGLLETSERLREEVFTLRLPLVLPDVEQARTEHERLLAQLDDYLLPRLRRMDAPLLAVIGGSTGAGKSTLTNSLVRREVSRSGVLRPTTRSPVLVHHPYDSGAFLSQRILPNLARVTAEAPEPLQPIDVDAPRITALRLVPHEAVPAGVAIIDAPDIDSVVDTNRELAVQLLAAADLWLFVTTAARYADAMPWDMLHTSVDRGASVAVVLDRVPRESIKEVRAHLATLLRDRGLASSPMFTIPETATTDGLLPAEVVAPLRGWLARLARDARSRDVVVRRTLAGALDSLRDRVHVVAAAADRQSEATARLSAELTEAFDTASAELRGRLADATILRGEVLARWQEFVGTGEFLRSLEANTGRIRDKIAASLRGRPAPAEPLNDALRTGVQAIVRAATQSALEKSVLRWRANPAGAALLAGGTAATLAPDFDARLAAAVDAWHGEVLDLVAAEGRGRRLSARASSLGGEGTAALLMLVVVGQDGETDGVAADATSLAQRILEAVFGDQAVRALTAKAHADLVALADDLVDSERVRLTAVLEAVGIVPDAGDRLRSAVLGVEETR